MYFRLGVIGNLVNSTGEYDRLIWVLSNLSQSGEVG